MRNERENWVGCVERTFEEKKKWTHTGSLEE